jgi:hypothetical protein
MSYITGRDWKNNAMITHAKRNSSQITGADIHRLMGK